MFRAHHDAVLAYALRRTAADDARDIVAETFLVAWRRYGAAPHECRLPWLYGVARRVLANQRRATNRRTALVHRLGTSPQPGTADDSPLLEALARLAETDREILLLVAWEGLSNEEAALVLGCRAATARMRLHRARRRLAVLLNHQAAIMPSTLSTEPT